jgi:hypothetical protein
LNLGQARLAKAMVSAIASAYSPCYGYSTVIRPR